MNNLHSLPSHTPPVPNVIQLLHALGGELESLARAHPEERSFRSTALGAATEAPPATLVLDPQAAYDACVAGVEIALKRCEDGRRRLRKRLDGRRVARLVASAVAIISEATLLAVIFGTDKKGLQAAIAALALIGSLFALVQAELERGLDDKANAPGLYQELTAALAKGEALQRNLSVIRPVLTNPATIPILNDLLQQTDDFSAKVLEILAKID